MQGTLYMEFGACLSAEGFTLDEAVIKVRALFEQQGMAGVVALLVSLIEEPLCQRLIRGETVKGIPGCCATPRYEYHGRRDKKFRTSVGTVKLSWRRLQCRHCNQVIIPLRSILHLAPYQAKTTELERAVIEVVSEQNYRRGSRHLATIGGIPVPKSTAHRWVAMTESDALPQPRKTLDAVMADGTGFKRRPDPENGINNRGEVRVALGINSRGHAVPLGAWTDLTWEEIGHQLTPQGDRQLAHVAVSDGERGLAEGLAHLANDQQRCQWHQIHDLNFVLWQDGVDLQQRRAYQQRLSGILGIELPATDFARVKPEEKQELQELMLKAETQLTRLTRELLRRGYDHAGKYVRYAKDRLFGYVRFWLQTGVVVPKVTSRLERMMREIGRRLKRIAFGWSDAGAAKMTRIIIKRFTQPQAWQRYWERKAHCVNAVTLTFGGVYAK